MHASPNNTGASENNSSHAPTKSRKRGANSNKSGDSRTKKKQKGHPGQGSEDERCPPSEALVEIKRLGPDKVQVVLAKGWENV